MSLFSVCSTPRRMQGASCQVHARRMVLAGCLLTGLMVIGATAASAQVLGSFRVMADSLPDVAHGGVAWGDVDGDGDYDVAIQPSRTGFYLNDGDVALETQGGTVAFTRYQTPFNVDGVFDARPFTPFATVGNAELRWTDLDGDGELDLVANGSSGADREVLLYRHVGGVQRYDRRARLPGTIDGDLALGDIDNDGDLDLVVTGFDASGTAVTWLYEHRREEGSPFTFTRRTIAQALDYGRVDLGDYDRDGDLDLLLTGTQRSPQRFVTAVYRNDGGQFTDVGATFDPLAFASAQWVDVDADGDLDVVQNGGVLSPFVLRGTVRIFHNEGGRFVDAGTDTRGGYQGALDAADYDADGLPDLAVQGGTAPLGGTLASVLRNRGGARFDTTFNDAGRRFGEFLWGDYDADGDLDLLTSGLTAVGEAVTRALRNELDIVNAVPSPPEGLRATRDGDAIVFAWDAASDDATPTPALTYALRVGTDPGAHDAMAVLSRADGRRRVPASGNVGPNTEWRLRLPEGAYYWSVQAIDGSLQGSPFSEEFIFTTGDPNDRTPPAVPRGLAAMPGDGRVTLTWTPNRDDDLARYRIYRSRPGTDPVRIASVTAGTGTTYVDTEVTNGVVYTYTLTSVDITGNESAPSTPVVADPLATLVPLDPGLVTANASRQAWGDYDADGDPDLAVTGVGRARFAALQINEGDTLITRPLTSQFSESVAWGDFDGDGDLDLAHGRGSQVAILRTTSGTFSTVVNLPATAGVDLRWGDVDGDGDLDLLLADFVGLRIARNDDGVFSLSERLLGSFSEMAVDWADADGDGDLDVLVAGVQGDQRIAVLYAYTDGTFERAGGFQGVAAPAVAWGDYDADGVLDVLISGITVVAARTRIYYGAGVASTAGLPELVADVQPGDFDNDGWADLLLRVGSQWQVYLNDRAGGFTHAQLTIPEDNGSASVTWVDYDGDTGLDLSVVSTPRGSIALNTVRPRNTPPAAPAGLTARTDVAGTTLSWAPATDVQTPTAALTYNLRIGTAPGLGDVKASQSLPDGTRLVPQPGNAGLRTTWTLQGLPAGTYYWSVQAVDASYAGSVFPGEQSFTVGGGSGATGSDGSPEPSTRTQGPSN